VGRVPDLGELAKDVLTEDLAPGRRRDHLVRTVPGEDFGKQPASAEQLLDRGALSHPVHNLVLARSALHRLDLKDRQRAEVLTVLDPQEVRSLRVVPEVQPPTRRRVVETDQHPPTPFWARLAIPPGGEKHAKK